MLSKTILILGCGTMQLPALRIAREMGWYVIAADANPDAEGRNLAHRFFPIDLKDTDSLAELGRNLKKEGSLDGVFTAGTDFSLSVAIVAEALGLPGHSVQASRLATDKILMRRRFREFGVPSPDFVELDGIAGSDESPESLEAIGNIARTVPGPWVVKPVDSMGARGVVRIDHVEKLPEAIRQARSYSRSGRALLESYVDGPEFSLDALVEDGRIIPCGLADRHICYPPYFIEIGHTIPSLLSEPVARQIWDVFEQGIRALGLSRGAAKGDIKLGSQGPVIGEIAARLSGGYMSGWTYPYSSGIESTRGALRLAVGLDADLGSNSEGRFCAERALICIDGKIRSLSGEKKALAIPGIKNLFLRYRPGSMVVFPRNNVEKLGNLIAVGATAQEAENRVRSALACIDVELDPSEKSTGEYLDAWGSFPPDAWVVENPDLDDLWRRFPPHPSRGPSRPVPAIHVPPSLKTPDGALPKDLAGRSLMDALALLQETRLMKVDNGSSWDGADQTDSDFWKALIRGGLPGARWFLEQNN